MLTASILTESHPSGFAGFTYPVHAERLDEAVDIAERFEVGDAFCAIHAERLDFARARRRIGRGVGRAADVRDRRVRAARDCRGERGKLARNRDRRAVVGDAADDRFRVAGAQVCKRRAVPVHPRRLHQIRQNRRRVERVAKRAVKPLHRKLRRVDAETVVAFDVDEWRITILSLFNAPNQIFHRMYRQRQTIIAIFRLVVNFHIMHMHIL